MCSYSCTPCARVDACPGAPTRTVTALWTGEVPGRRLYVLEYVYRESFDEKQRPAHTLLRALSYSYTARPPRPRPARRATATRRTPTATRTTVAHRHRPESARDRESHFFFYAARRIGRVAHGLTVLLYEVGTPRPRGLMR